MNSKISKPAAELTELSAALHAKCPRCRKGDMFSTSMYGLRLQKMNRLCPCCHLQFEREPGYFYVAMFISYGMNVFEMIVAGVITWLVTGNAENPWLYIGVIFVVILFFSPFNYRFSRVILLYWLTPGLHYSPDRARGKLQK